MQTRWYNVRDTVPPAYWAFLSSSVKKSSGLAKRLVRLSEIFLFDFKDWCVRSRLCGGRSVSCLCRSFPLIPSLPSACTGLAFKKRPA